MIVAVRDIKPFETIIIDRPAIIGPFDDTLPQCLECYREVDVNGYKVSIQVDNQRLDSIHIVSVGSAICLCVVQSVRMVRTMLLSVRYSVSHRL